MLKIILRLRNIKLSMQPYKLTGLLLLFLAVFSNGLFAQDFSAQNSKYNPSIYGSKSTYEEDKFFYFSELAGVLFLRGSIETGMYKNFRQAITDNDIHTLVLDSPGGNVSEGLRIAGTVFDRKIKTYIRERKTCESACSYIFLSGSKRYTLGKLGVHQIAFNADFSKQKLEVGEIGKQFQVTNADIIQYLDENDTPGFVYKYMLRTPPEEMYYFNEDELNQLGNLHISAQDRLNFSRIDAFSKDYDTHIIKNKCDSDTNSCTATQLCFRAAKDEVWLTSLDALKFVKLAKSKGLSCGVPTPVCPENIRDCDKEYLCTYGTTNINSNLSWLNNSFADEAKSRGYLCGIKSKLATKTEIKKPQCYEKAVLCSNGELCMWATQILKNNIRVWNPLDYFDQFIEEAKARSLSCDVTVFDKSKIQNTCYQNSIKCNTEQLCQVATKNTSKGKEWKSNLYWAKHVADAKRRGLTCSVISKPEIINRIKSKIYPIRIALSQFDALGDIEAAEVELITNKIMAGLIANDNISEIPKTNYVTEIINFNAPVRFSDWSIINVDALITGSLNIKNEKLVLQFRLFDVNAQKPLGEGIQYQTSVGNWSKVASKASNEIKIRLLGKSNTQDASLDQRTNKYIKMTAPVDGEIIRDFSTKPGESEGIDYKVDGGTIVRAATKGTVALISESVGNTTIVLLRHDNNLYTVYSNITGVKLKKDVVVKAGQTIGLASSGSPSFVHFEVRQGTKAVDPLMYLIQN